jgi:predicted permease
MQRDASNKWHRYLRFWRINVGADVDAEIAFHVDARTQELIEEGLDARVARTQALREFGDVDRARGVLRAMDERYAAQSRRAEVFTDLWQDVRIAARSLRRTPGFVATVAFTLAIGIGLNTAVYSIVDAYLFRPMPVANGKDLVVLAQTDAAFAQPHEMSFPNYKDFAGDTAVFRGLAAYVINSMNLSGGRGAERIWTEEGTANYFAVLGVKPLLGRLFQPGDDDGEVAHPYIVLSYKFWQSHFGGNPNVVGDTIRLNNHPMTIIGVTPPEFHGKDPLLDIDAFTPLNQTWPSFGRSLHDRANSSLNAFGLLQRGVSVAAAKQAVHAKSRALERQYPETNRNVDFVLAPETHTRPNIAVSANVPTIAAAFMVLVLLVLAIACANVTSLLLARATAQYKEQAIRAALGANQWRLARRVLVECLMLAVMGGIGAVLLAQVAVRALAGIRVAADVPIRWTITVDNRVLGFTLLIVGLTAVLAAIAPAFAMRRTNLTEVLKSGARGSGGRVHQRVRGFLVAAQIAVSVVIVVCAALFARSTSNASRINLGYRIDHILMASATLGIQGYDTLRGKQFEREVVRRVAQLPGVRSVALARYTPLGYNNDIEYALPEASQVKIPENGIGCFNNIVTPEYFATMGIPIIEGRGFDAHDDEHSPKVAVVTRRFAQQVWPGMSAVGKRFRIDKDGPLYDIVGVSADIQYFSIGEPPKAFFFRPYAQTYRSTFTLNVLTASDPGMLANPLRAAIATLDPGLPVFDVRSMQDHVVNGRALLGTRIGAVFAAVFGVLALVLASVGVYGLISYSVAQRTREIGIRVALGARMPVVIGLIVRQGLTIAVTGIAVGVALALLVTGLLSKLLYGVAPHDPLIFAAVSLALVAVGGVASLLPARRATRVDPLTALRAE